MAGLNPNSERGEQLRGWPRRENVALETARVRTVPSHSGGTDGVHAVEIVPDFADEPMLADIVVGQRGDTAIPEEGDRVVIAKQRDTRPVVLGVRYQEGDTIPAYEAGERRVGHPKGGGEVVFDADGTVTVRGDGGNTVELQPDGDVVINGGTDNPVTDVSTTKDADGHVTSISLTRSGSVYL